MVLAGEANTPGEAVMVEQSSSLVDRVMAEVSRHIRDKALTVGTALPSEAEFAARVGVSRAVAREGFRGLAALRLIDIGNGRRARVAAADESVTSLLIEHAVHTKQVNIQQILDVRRSIELRTVVLAALRRTEREAADIATTAVEMLRRFSEPAQVMELDMSFHEAIARASRNPLFALLVGSFRVVTHETWAIGWASRPNDDARRDSVGGHSVIARAIQDRDPQAAEKAMADHFDLTVRALLNAGVT
jgi:GntR family transcriptional regulator, transcriptional repressor for pyruvate dehydrogenase complex